MENKESMDTKQKFKRVTITSALPYANGPIHIGHLAGVYVPADIYARYLRLKGEDVLFIGGSDEHGVPITIKAKQEGVTPQDIVDKYHSVIKKSFEDFGISFDVYSRTSAKIHHETASEFFRKLYDENKFIEKITEQYFDVEASQFLADRYITGTCPHCNNEKAYGDQCEKCGTSLNATDLINPKSVLSGNVPVLKKTKHWFLPLDKYESWLKQWILEGHKKDWKTNVYGQCKSWLDQGLQPRAVTRDLDWGVKVPIPGTEGKVLYVWFDAPIGYISATKEWAIEKNTDWEKYWKAPDTKLVHFIGKDNIVFHCIIFPTMLHAEGTYILPENVPANEFLNLEGDKISTSRNWAVWLHEYLQEFPDKQDVLRYVLTSNAPETKDNDFTWKDFQLKNNSELVAILGNFINRTLVLTDKYYGGKVPQVKKENGIQLPKQKDFTIPDTNVNITLIENAIEKYNFREALTQLMFIARTGNKFLSDNEPWHKIKTDSEGTAEVIHTCLQMIAQLSIAMSPFLPFTSEKLRKILNLNNNFIWSDCYNYNLLGDGHVLNKPSLLFVQIEDSAIEAQIKKLHDTKVSNETGLVSVKPAKQNIEYEDFAKLDIRTGIILTAEKVAKTKKLLKLTIDTGIDKRTVVSGIAEYYEPEKIIGQKVSILVNLQPKEIKGIQSQGMILMAENSKGELVFVSAIKDIEAGSEIK